MILAAYGDTLFKVLFLGHMLSFVVAFAPAVINPILMARLKAQGDHAALPKVAGIVSSNGRQIHFPALVALGGFGIAMVLTSDPAITFGDTWVSLAFLVWLAITGLVSAVMLPGERKMAEGDLSVEKRVETCGQVITVLTLVMLYLMIWKPGA
jgi:threonine/homoserine/homoserine lactone efflux protein